MSLNKASLILVFVFALISGKVNGQAVDCSVSLSCHKRVQVSLESNCMATVTADMMLSHMDFLESDYRVTIKDPNGVLLPDNTVDDTYVGMVLEVSVELLGCNNYCWGEILVEDKLGPLASGCADITITCDDSLIPGIDIPAISFVDGCEGSVPFDYRDSVDLRPCDDIYAQVIYRTYFAIDSRGNIGTCSQEISILKGEIEDVTFPENYDGFQNDVFECGELSPNQLKENGAPKPEVTGFPTGISCFNIQSFHEDLVFDLCGNSLKVLREWTVINWCTGQDTMGAQVIKILDTQEPVCLENENTINMAYTEEGKCTARYIVPEPRVTDCSEYTYTVGYKEKVEGEDPFTDLIYHKIQVNNGIYVLEELPLDTFWVVYTIVDDCNNRTQCANVVIVADNQRPTAICEGFTVVTLDNRGYAEMKAESLDDYSWDNCMIDRFEIRKEVDNCGDVLNTTFRDSITFCCADTEVDYIMVTLRVYDIYGNYSDCRGQVRVQDKILPTIECPPDTSIICTEDIDRIAMYNPARGYDNCGVIVDYEDDNSRLNDCGIGTVIRRWTATDQFGNEVSCIQEIDITPVKELTYNNINWPMNTEIYGCSAQDADPDGRAGRPTVSDGDCMDIGISYKDQIFYDTENACKKILRKWKVADWCTFDKNNPFYFEYEQVIKLINEQGPTFVSGCDFRVEETGSCTAIVDVQTLAVDDCTNEKDIKYRYEVDLNNNNSIDRVGTGNDASGSFPVGQHLIIFYARDECNNETSCDFILTIRDNKPPTPICLGEIIWVLDSDGTTEVWAEDFNLKSTDLCSGEDNLRFSFTESGNTPAFTFDCSDIPNGISAEIPLTMWVLDESDNAASCDVILKLQDNNANACFDDPNARAQVAGRIINEENEGLPDVEVDLENIKMAEASHSMTNIDGFYGFDQVGFMNSYQLEPHKNDDTRNGVSTIDLVLIQQYIFGQRAIESPYKLIAADINNDRKISAIDLIQLRKVILGIETEFPSNTSWKFIPEEYEFEDIANPWNYPDDMMLDELMYSEEELDFVAVKIGDINATATIRARERTTTRNNSFSIAARSEVIAGKQWISFYPGDFPETILGFQMTLDFGSAVKIQAIKGNQLNISTDNLGIQKMNEGLLAVSWNDFNPKTIVEGPLFSLLLEDNINLSRLKVTEGITKPEVYDRNGLINDLELNIEGEKNDINSPFTVYQNQPNPFSDQSSIDFILPHSGQVTLSIFDLSGKEIKRINDEYDAGNNRVVIQRNTFPSNGIYYYSLQFGENQITKKMIIMD